MTRWAALAGLAVAALVACEGTGIEAEGPSGMLAGHVSVGPFCPVEIEGQECPPPPGIYESIEIVVSALAGGTDRLVITARPDAEGRFELRLPAGDYRVRLEHSIGIGGAPPEVQAVHVDAGATTTIAFDVDTGIR